MFDQAFLHPSLEHLSSVVNCKWETKMDEMLVIVVDGSLSLSSHWDNVKTILESIVRRFCMNEASTSSGPSVKKYNLSLIVNAGIYDFAQSDGTIRLDSFLHSLSSLNIQECCPVSNYGVSEGLSLALKLFQFTNNKQPTHLSWKQHCVLVTANHPSPDAKRLARSFIESFVSFSVICPRDMSTDNETTDDDAGNIIQYPLTVSLKHPRILLFISQQFPEARDALEKFATDNINSNLEQDPPISCPTFSDEEVMLLENIFSQPQMKQQNEDENMQIIADDVIRVVPPYDSMLNPNVVGETMPLEPLSHDVLGDNFINQGMQTEYLQDELNVAGESIQFTPEEMEVLNNLISRDICPFQVPQSNSVVRFNDFNMNGQIEMARLLSSQVRINEETTISSASHPSQSSIYKPNNSFHPSTPLLLNNNPETMLISSNSKMFTPRTDAIRSDSVPRSSILTTSSGTSGTTSMFSTNMQRPSVNSSRGKMVVLGEKNRIPSISYPTTKHVISTKNTHRASIYNNGKKKLLSTKAPESRTNHIVTSRVTNVPSSRTSCHLNLSQISASPRLSSSHMLTRKISSEVVSGYIKAWEGSIASRGSGVTIFVSKLVAYKKNTIPEWIFENWPKMMQLAHLVPRTQPNSSPTQANKIRLVFKMLDSSPIWDHMHEKNLFGYVALPGQMLKLWMSEDKSILMGTLYHLKG